MTGAEPASIQCQGRSQKFVTGVEPASILWSQHFFVMEAEPSLCEVESILRFTFEFSLHLLSLLSGKQ